MYQGFRLNLGKSFFFGKFWRFEKLSLVLEAAGYVPKIGSSPKSNNQIKLKLSKYLIHTGVDVYSAENKQIVDVKIKVNIFCVVW